MTENGPDSELARIDAGLAFAAIVLGDLVSEVVFVGGAVIGLWVDAPAAPETRPTDDVDVICEIATRGDYADFEQRLFAQDFANDTRQGAPLCRYRHPRGVVLDAMPRRGARLLQSLVPGGVRVGG